MATERIIAIDFGTSTSVVRVKRYQGGKPIGDRLETKAVTFNMGSTVVPTLIQQRDTGENLYFGYDAEIPRRNTVTHRNFKTEIEAPDPTVRERARDLTADFFRYIYKTYREQSLSGHLGETDDRERTVISYPVKWSEETKAFMLETAKNAGFLNVEGQDEAQAAIQAVTIQSEKQLRNSGYLTAGQPANILLIDMGAGTTDLVLCRHTLGDTARTEILATWPHRAGTLFGGQEVDELLRSYVKGLLPADSAEKVLKRLGADKFKAWKEQEVSPALARGETVDYFSALDDRLEDMEMEIDYSIDRRTFEDFAQGYLRGFPELVSGCLNEAGMTGDQVDLVVLTGGHSQWYFVREMLGGSLERFGETGLTKIQVAPDRIISIALPQETVALGLAYGSLRTELPKLEPKPAQKPKSPEIITPMPPVLHTSQLARLSPPVRPVLPGKSATMEEIRDFYRKTRWTTGSCYLRCDGTVVSEHSNTQCKWRDIVSIAADEGEYGHMVGLQSDGTVVAVGSNKLGQCNVQDWTEIVDIGCICSGTVGLRSDGAVIVAGKGWHSWGAWQAVNIDWQGIAWQGIVAIDCEFLSAVGLQPDGTLKIDGGYIKCDQYNVQDWKNIVAIACGWKHIVGLRPDGTVVAVGDNCRGQCDVQSWKNIVSVTCGANHTVGLREDGTAVATGDITCGQCDLREWKNILSISALKNTTIAVLNDGSVMRPNYWVENKATGLFGMKQECISHYRPPKTLPFKLF